MTRLTAFKLAAAALLLGVLALTGLAPAQARIGAPRSSQSYPPPSGPPPVNDAFASAKVVTGVPYQDTVSVGYGSIETLEPTPGCASGIAASAWYVFTPSTTARVSTGVTNNTWPPVSAAVYTGSGLTGLTQVACQSAPTLTTFEASAGTTYYIQLSSPVPLYGNFTFVVQPPPAPIVSPFYFPLPPSRYDTVQFYGYASDPAGLGIASEVWAFGDGATASGSAPAHRYAADGDYKVTVTVTTVDGRTSTATLDVQVRTHDVAITRFSTPNSGRSGQTRGISVDVAASTYPEKVQVQLLKSSTGYSSYELVGTLVQDVPVRSSGRAVSFDFSYTFTADDAAVGKVTFKAVATIVSGRDALTADNEAVATTQVSR